MSTGSSDLERIFAGVEKRPRISGRAPSDEPPARTPDELAEERGEPWPPVQEEAPTPVATSPGGNELPGGPPRPNPESPGVGGPPVAVRRGLPP